MTEVLLSSTTPETRYVIEAGTPHPLGTTIDQDGVNFSFYANGAVSASLLLFEHPDDSLPAQVIAFSPTQNKTFSFWHMYIKGLNQRAGRVYYAFRVNGPNDPSGKGERYNGNKVLIDPYARGNYDQLWQRQDALGPGDNVATSMRSVLIDPSNYDWEGDQPLKHRWNETIIYEMHVRGFTQSSTAGCFCPGTFRGVIEKIAYLQSLGITAVELLPVFDFDQKQVMGTNPVTDQPLTNYWGYDPIAYFAPQASYCVSPEMGEHLNEFRDMVKALHRAGIEVILDVVFNHTGEGNENGPTISLKGLANSTYYLLTPQDKQYYWNFSGAGNTVNANHPVTSKLITDALEYWVKEMHVDGFRFDEAVILTRAENGAPMVHPPLIWQIELSDVLASTKVIAEPWDAGGLYEVGTFPGQRWGVWNGRYRDALRRFVKGASGWLENQTITARVATVMAGSADIFQSGGELPTNSVNFFTSHDGFTLNDLVSYNDKHNEANGQNNTDGINDNWSWNCGHEGPSADPVVEALRERQARNCLAILLLSQGTPMFVAGDEVRRTQQGNNNAYCQDNELSWFDWSLVEKHAPLLRFCQKMIAFRQQHSILRRAQFFNGQKNSRGLQDIAWHGCRLNSPGWFDPACHVLSITMGGLTDAQDGQEDDLHIILNMDQQDLDFDLPAVPGRAWLKVIDTSRPSPADIAENLLGPLDDVVIVGPGSYHAPGRSVSVFLSRPVNA
ncbi:MAG TPA: glycogen debranching protein GlgX [Ktedonobacteraceae bacterium]